MTLSDAPEWAQSLHDKLDNLLSHFEHADAPAAVLAVSPDVAPEAATVQTGSFNPVTGQAVDNAPPRYDDHGQQVEVAPAQEPTRIDDHGNVVTSPDTSDAPTDAESSSSPVPASEAPSPASEPVPDMTAPVIPQFPGDTTSAPAVTNEAP